MSRVKSKAVKTATAPAANPLSAVSDRASAKARTVDFVRLVKPHRHAGREYAIGKRLQVPADTATWLIAEGVAKRDNGAGNDAE